ncbi:hypothetical protein DS884_04625 [Tenacibaculum sp. E3R01]|uniref:hypothetical protein n=1 Tax=Tenacibaculum sp. E3R01 TaxID=2267227 RepID=UPI000DE90313|nr:hypothetical protein [Tenacibaculum sp. E3R01]RBW60322.1 hypothetical protein DS884_04625 [Tenacibaculum sp. E3R01]
MPSTIPYDPSLVLGNIVSKQKLENIVQISKLQTPADAAESEMNSLIALKRSIDMTIQEMIGMGIDADEVIQESQQVGDQIKTAVVAYAKAKIASEKKIQPLKSKMNAVNESVESPIDYNKSQLKKLAISSDSLQMNCQYFSFDQNTQSSASHAATVSAFVSESLSIFGEGRSSQASASAQTQMNSQHSRHSIAGTLVVTITCTHKNAQVFAPYILDVDKAVRVWNSMNPDNMIKTNNPGSIAAIEAKSDTKEDGSFNILSGATYGSSFVGMVHVLNTTESQSSQSMESIAASMQETFDIGGWFASGTGGFGVSSSFSNSAKNLLSTQNVTSHATLITMGIIPSIKSNQVAMAVKSFTDFDPQKSMEELATLQGATASENNTIGEAATAARTGEQMIQLKNATIAATLSGVSDIDDGQNQIIDTNSMMTALEDYVNKCIEGGDNLGVPVNYYLKPISQSEIARAWLAKYYPNKYNQAGAADDSTISTSSTSSTSDNSGASDE